MNGKELMSKLMELDDRDFANVGRIKPHSQNSNTRLLLLELGVHLLDESEMLVFRECHNKAAKMKAEKIFRENARRAESLKTELVEAVKKVEGHIVVLTPGQANVTVKGVKLLWQCPKCGENQEADLSKSEDDLKFLKVNDKYVNLHRRSTKGPPPRAIAGGEKLLFKNPDTMKMSETSLSRGGAGVVSMPALQNNAAVLRLARGDTIYFEFGCGKCNFRNREIKIGVK